MQLKNLFIGLALSGMLGAGVLTGVAMNSKTDSAGAATSTTIYYAKSTSYSVKCNVHFGSNDSDPWGTYDMTANGKTFGGKTVYTCTFTDQWDGLATMQLQLYNGGDWVSQEVPISSWTSASTYNGKIWDGSWKTYTPDTVLKVTRYAVCDGGSPVKIDDETVAEGATYAVPGKIYRSGYSFGGWYTNTGCTNAYTSRAINANTSIYAKYTSGTWEGTVHIDLRDSGWANAGANYAILFMDKTTYVSEVDEWSTYVTGVAADEHLVEVPYSIGFEPLEMVVVRYNSSYSQASWNSNKWSSVWNQTKDINFNAAVRIGSTKEDDKNLAYLGFPKVIGGNGSWADITYLNSVKCNGEHHAEYYSTAVTLAAGDDFKIQVAPYESGDYYGTYTPHDSIKSNFSGGGSSNIHTVTGGTYAFYFDSINNSVYITKVEIAEADEWAQYFLNNVGCDASGVNLPSGWSACATEYGKLSNAAKNYVYAAEADVGGTYTEQAVARYDLAVKNHSSLTKFIVNSSSTPRASAINNPAVLESTNNSSLVTIVIMVSLVAVSALGGYFFLRHKKEN